MHPAVVTGLIAHQGGWDEVLLIGVPILAIAVALRIAKRRVDASATTSAQESAATSDPDR